MNDKCDNSLISLFSFEDKKIDLNNIDALLFQNKLNEIFLERVVSYTMYHSSSLPVQTAQELYLSVCFLVNMYIKKSSISPSSLLNMNANTLLENAWKEIEAQLVLCRQMFVQIKSTSPHIENLSYKDTINEIDNFFKFYDYKFFAHQIPCSIDYQLAHAVDNKLLGIEYICEYLNKLKIENTFLNNFNNSAIQALLHSASPEYKHLLINIFEPAAINAIALALLNADVFKLNVTHTDRELLLFYFKKWTKQETETNLIKSAQKLCILLNIEDISFKTYLKKTACNLCPRIQAVLQTNSLDNIFLSFKNENLNTSASVNYLDNKLMDDEFLRDLIDEIKSCKITSDKIELVEKHINSLGDLVEILNECFWDEELIMLFNSFDAAKLKLLDYYLNRNNNTFNSLTGWENIFLNYIHNININKM